MLLTGVQLTDGHAQLLQKQAQLLRAGCPGGKEVAKARIQLAALCCQCVTHILEVGLCLLARLGISAGCNLGRSMPRLAVALCKPLSPGLCLGRDGGGGHTLLLLLLVLHTPLLLPLQPGLCLLCAWLLVGRCCWPPLQCCMQLVTLHQQVRILQHDMLALKPAATEYAAAQPRQWGQQVRNVRRGC
jgi:hypothetical protein